MDKLESPRFNTGDKVSIPDENGNLVYGEVEEQHSLFIDSKGILCVAYIVVLDNGRRGCWAIEDGLKLAN